jgi:tetratricopeptide (TPR) repeat protein
VEAVLEYGRWALLVLVVAGTLLLIRRLVASGPELKAKNLERGARRELQALAKAGDVLRAGDVAMRFEAFEDAADFYVRGKDFVRAADAFLKAGKRTEAINYYKRAGQPRRAAELFEKAGNKRQAAQEYAQSGDIQRAAALFLECSDFRRAAELYEELGQWREAAQALERLNDGDGALRAWASYLEQELNLRRGREISREVKERAREVARQLQSKGQTAQAAALLEQSGQKAQAAALLAQAGDQARAVQLYLEANQPEEAARLLAKSGDDMAAARYRAEAALKRGDRALAARELEAAGDPARAAELYVDLGDAATAAKLYEKVGDLHGAAAQYRAAQDLPNAARCYEAIKDWMSAAAVYQQLQQLEGALRCLGLAERWYEMGALLIKNERMEEALVAFQRVPLAAAEFRAAAELSGDILLSRNQGAIALERYRAAAQDQAPRAQNLTIFYKIAVCLDTLGEQEEARRAYERVLAVDYYFKDAKTRMERLNARAMPTNPSPPATPRGNERYQIIAEIARGGMGVVYRARDKVLDREIAYKILSESLKNNPVAVKYFLREAKAAASLSHPNIVAVFDAGEQDGEYYMAMELLSGDTLKGLVTRSGPFQEKLLRYIVQHACRGLSYAHAKSIVHRDIKSGNIMLTRDRSVKLMDFGLAKSIEQTTNDHTKAIGTPFYMSPEQILGKDLDHRSDLYSLGVTLFECATGTVPFYKGELSYHHLHTPPPQPRALNPNLSPQMEEIILKLLQKDPDQRFPSADAILKALR